MTLDELEQAYRVTEDVRERITDETIRDMENGDPLIINAKLELLKDMLNGHSDAILLSREVLTEIDNDLSRLEDFSNKQAERIDLMVQLMTVQNERIRELEVNSF